MSSEVSQSTNLAVIVITAIFGGLIVIITFLWRNNNKSVELATEEITVDSEKWVDQKPEPTKTKKKQASDRKWNDAKANFYHEFLLSTLKGHAGNILGMDFSSNGKYLLSCSEGRYVRPFFSTLIPEYQCYGPAKENYNSMESLKELQMTRDEIYQELMMYILRSDEKEKFGYPIEDVRNPGSTIIPETNNFFGEPDSNSKKCNRCKKNFDYICDLDDRCVHHWGKLRKAPLASQTLIYTCCRQPRGAKGCRSTRFHVSSKIAVNDRAHFVKTKAPRKGHPKKDHGVYAIDCEMSYTTIGLELTKVSVVGLDGTIVYDTYVRPTNPVLDYNTQYSGVTPEHLVHCDTDLEQVQHELLSFISSRTILVGHGLENDLKALHMVHSLVIDTAVLFPHHMGFPYRRSLKDLVSSCLCRNIQVNEFGQGHDSVEDSRSAMEVLLWKLKQDKEKNKSKTMYTYDPFE